MPLPPLEPLVERTIAGDEGAWQELCRLIQPRVLSMTRRPQFLGKLGQDADHRHNVGVAVLDALRADGCARLRAYVAARAENPELPFLAWLAVVTKRLAIDYLRRQDEYEDRRGDASASSPGRWREIEPLGSDSTVAGPAPEVTRRETARELLEYAAAELPAEQRVLLEGWARGESFEELARAHGLADARAAEKQVRAACERLRRHFRTTGARS
jgi:DNA-directed RNA polymerase specialized sigma24 family protein